VDVELGELVPERVWQASALASLFSCRRTADPAAAARRGRAAFGVLAPDDVPVVVG
jgi:hypothetical protein